MKLIERVPFEIQTLKASDEALNEDGKKIRFKRLTKETLFVF